jgi:hypothetical protein
MRRIKGKREKGEGNLSTISVTIIRYPRIFSNTSPLSSFLFVVVVIVDVLVVVPYLKYKFNFLLLLCI